MLTVDDYGAIRRARRDGMTIREIARTFQGRHSRTVKGEEFVTTVHVHDMGVNPDKKVGALNYGFRLARGYDYVLGVDGDTTLERRAVLSRRIRLFVAATITYNVIEAAVKLGIRKIIIASSETTYGVCFAEGDKDFHGFPLEENYDSDPMDSYGLSKVVNEKTARAFAMRSGLRIRIVPGSSTGISFCRNCCTSRSLKWTKGWMHAATSAVIRTWPRSRRSCATRGKTACGPRRSS